MTVGRPVLHGREAEGHVGDRCTLEQFERTCLIQRHTRYMSEMVGEWLMTVPMINFVAIDIDRDPPCGAGPHREGADVRTWWSTEALARTAEDLDAYMSQPREVWSAPCLRW